MRPGSEAFDRILSNHMTLLHGLRQQQWKLHGAQHDQDCWRLSISDIPFQTKPYEVDNTNPFYRYDPDQCILCGRCVEACQNVK